MIRKMIFILAFLANIAWGNGCGIKSNLITDKINYTGSINQREFSGFACVEDPARDNENVVLNYVNLQTGVFKCNYGDPVELSEEEIIAKGLNPQTYEQGKEDAPKTNEACQNELMEIFSDKTEFKSDKSQKSFSVKAFGGIVYNSNGYLGTSSMSGLTEQFNFQEIFKKIQDGNDIYYNNDDIFGRKSAETLNTNEGGKLTISDYMTGALVLDSAVFSNNKDQIESATGNLNFKIDNLEHNGILKINENSSVITAINPITTILNTKLWGFYTYFVENLRAAERFIILTLFLTGFAGLVGQKLLQAGYAYWGGNDSKPNIEWKKTAIAPMMSLIFFVAPVVPTGIQIPDHFLLKKDIGEAGIVLNGNGAGNQNANNGNFVEADYTTVIQTMIQYFVRWGNTAANTFADYALYPYLKYLQTQEGIAVGDALMGFIPSFEEIEKQFVVLTATNQFYQNVCRPIYEKINRNPGDTDGTAAKKSAFMSPRLAGQTPDKLKSLTNRALAAVQSGDEIFFQNNEFGVAKIVSAEACAEIENQIQNITVTYIDRYSILRRDLERILNNAKASTGNKTADKDSTHTLQSHQDIITKMAFLQESSGWIFSAMTPISYIMLRMKDIQDESETARNNLATLNQNYISNRIENNTATSNKNEENNEASKAELDEMSKSYLKTMIEYGIYFSLPGFTGIYNGVDSVIQKAGNVSASLISFVGAVSPVGKALSGKMSEYKSILDAKTPKTLKEAGFNTSNFLFGTGQILYTLTAKVLALMMAVAIYDIAIVFVSMSIITMMAIFRISFYFIEVLMFFVASPAVVIWAAISNRPEVIWKYAAKGAVLAITPILIVLSCYTFIFVQELLTSITIHFASLLQNVFYGEKAANLTSLDLPNSIGITTLVSGLMLIKSVFSIFAGYIVIIKFNGWFLKKIGAEEGMFDQLSTEMTRKAEGMMSPVKH